MSTHEKLRALDQIQEYDSRNRTRTVGTKIIPTYIRQLHESVLDGDADHYTATDQEAVAYFHIRREDYPDPPSWESVDQITLAYRRRK